MLNSGLLRPLGEILRIPEKIHPPERSCGFWRESLIMLLKRFVYPYRLSDMVPRFGRSVPEISLILAEATDHVKTLGHLHLDQPRLQPHHLDEIDQAIHQKSAVLDNCWGFLDRTVRPICRLGEISATSIMATNECTG